MPNITFGRWNPTEVLERRLDNDWPSPTPYATNLVTPTSISSTGTGNSSSIGANGSVTFSSCATLSLNGVFTSDFDNYMIVIRHQGTVTTDELQFRLRLSGTDATGANYVYQQLAALSTTVQALRVSSNTWARLGNAVSALRSGDTTYIFGPNLAQPTAMRATQASAYDNASVIDHASTHSLSTAYDGFSVFPQSGTIAGLISVYGLGV